MSGYISFTRKPITISTTYAGIGIGEWSPNGQYLLAGLAGWVSKKLVAVEVKTGQVIVMMPIGDLAGYWFVWIKKAFLSANSPLA